MITPPATLIDHHTRIGRYAYSPLAKFNILTTRDDITSGSYGQCYWHYILFCATHAFAGCHHSTWLSMHFPIIFCPWAPRLRAPRQSQSFWNVSHEFEGATLCLLPRILFLWIRMVPDYFEIAATELPSQPPLISRCILFILHVLARLHTALRRQPRQSWQRTKMDSARGADDYLRWAEYWYQYCLSQCRLAPPGRREL